MQRYKYLVVGGGMTADAAVKGVREIDNTNPIAVIGSEPFSPYKRPPLTKGLWKGKGIDTIWRHTREAGVDLYPGRSVITYDPARHAVIDDTGETYTYEKLLLATGGAPRRLGFADDSVIYFRTLNDYYRLLALADHYSNFLVIGSGFIGSEIAAALAMNGKHVTLVFPGAGIGGHFYPPALSEFLSEYYRQKGVEVLPGETVQAVEQEGVRSIAITRSGKRIASDAVIAGIGIEPNVGLAKAAGLAVDNGIVVDDFLRTSNLDTYASGDVANYFSTALGNRRRIEHEDNANTMGRVAGRNMAGAGERYDYLPFFYSDLFELGYEAVGEFGPHLQVVEDWKSRFEKGVLYYLKEGRVRGVLLWNTWGQVDVARNLIASREPISPEVLIGRIHD